MAYPHNDQVAADALRGIVAAIERCDDRITSENKQKSEILKKAKKDGFNVKALRKVIDLPTHSPEAARPTAADNARSIRPWCLHADDLSKCAGQGRKHCHGCLKAHADAEGLSA